MTAGRELTVEARRHPRGWIMVPLILPILPAASWDLFLMLNTGRPLSVLSMRTRNVLLATGLLEPRSGNLYRLRAPRLAGEPLPENVARASAGPDLLGVDGMLGLDFLDLFAEVRLDTRSLRLTLVQT